MHGPCLRRDGRRTLLAVIVCHCRGLNDRAVRAAIDAGADTLDQLAATCGAGARCGGCHPLLIELLIEARARRSVAA